MMILPNKILQVGQAMLVNKIGEIKRKFIGKTQLSTGAMGRENV